METFVTAVQKIILSCGRLSETNFVLARLGAFFHRTPNAGAPHGPYTVAKEKDTAAPKYD